MKRKMFAILTAAAVMMSLAACGSSSGETAQSTAESASEEMVHVGISQFAEHGSLDDCREGFIEGMAENGFVEGENVTYDLQNANADTAMASTIADNFVSKGYDLICAIATPSAMSAFNSTLKTEIPVIYTAVTDPVAAQLAKEDGSPAGNITGTSDVLPIEPQLQLIRELLPDAKTIGILHTSSETNSDSALASYQELAPKYGFEIVDKAVSTQADVQSAAADLASKVDCISNLTDNTVVAALQTEIEEAKKAGIPVFGSEIDQVKAGCLACEGLDYEVLGKQTGAMAAKVLKGEAEASEMNFETITEPGTFVNLAVAENFGIDIPDNYADGSEATVFDTIQESTQG